MSKEWKVIDVLNKSITRSFIQKKIDDDIENGKFNGRVVTRFPPEPNGYLHIGHAKSICLNFGVVKAYGGYCHLRFDDTDPEGERSQFVEAIKQDIEWLGYDWGEHLYFASDYFEKLYNFAVRLIEMGKAYVCALDMEEFKEYRGVPTKPGKESPFRDRPIKENLELFELMRADKFQEGEYVLRAKIDMSSPNLHMRDPVIYRIKKSIHYRTGNNWCIYPMYDFTHCLSDAMEKVTHSLCTIEFEVHRPLYNWYLVQLGVFPSEQTEFAPLNLSYSITSKRRIQELVNKRLVSGWDDPRLPTLKGLRRRGYTPSAIRLFCERVGITKFEGLTDISLLEHCIREDLNKKCERRLVVLRPLRVVVENYSEGDSEEFDAINNPEDISSGSRKVPFSRVLYIERDDFMENPPKNFFRLAPGREVRLRYACYITCTEVIKDEETGGVIELRCTYDPESRGAKTPDRRRVKGTIHWVSVVHAAKVEVRLYDRLFCVENPIADKSSDFKKFLDPNSFESVTALVEPMVTKSAPGTCFQFERLGYFCVDTVDSVAGHPVFNRTVTLRNSWEKKQNI